MSVRTMARVWELSTHGGTELLMLLAIADFADDDALHWHAANGMRLAAGAEKRREQQYAKERTGYRDVRPLTEQRHAEAKRNASAALRVLAKACAKSLQVETIDVDATEPPTLSLTAGDALP